MQRSRKKVHRRDSSPPRSINLIHMLPARHSSRSGVHVHRRPVRLPMSMPIAHLRASRTQHTRFRVTGSSPRLSHSLRLEIELCFLCGVYVV